MKENLSHEFLDLRKFENHISPIDLIKNITSTPNVDADPFYIVDLEDICNKHINWITRLPRVEPHYAIKCNTDTMLLKLLAFLGAGFDCASKSEIQRVLELGVSPHRIIYANPCKQASNVRYAYKMGVDYMTFDNELELHKIKEHHPRAKCVLRLATNDEHAVCRFSMKFGTDMDTAQRLVEAAVRLDLDLVGVSFHVGSGQMSPHTFAESIANARSIFDYARNTCGVKMHLLDLGGGYPGASDSGELFGEIAREINRALDEHFAPEFFDEINGTGDNKLRVIAEPGRYYACSAFTLCVSVIAKRVMQQSIQQQAADKESVLFQQQTQPIDESHSNMYYINDGVYASFNCLFYDHAECLPTLISEASTGAAAAGNALIKSSIWGPTCDGLDLVVKECYLPDMPVGECLVFKNMGAYTISGAVAFNGIPLARCIYVASTSWNTIKEAFNEPVDEPSCCALVKEEAAAYSSTCAAAATLAFTRAISSIQQQQRAADHDHVQSAVASAVDDELPEEVANATTIDCAITC